MKLSELLEGIEKRVIGDLQDFEVKTVTDNSEKVGFDSVFVCIKGESVDGHDFAYRAVERGARVLVVERALNAGVPQIVVDNTKKVFSLLLSRFYGSPESKLVKVGVTGTNGKTTVTTLIKHVEDSISRPFGLIGTINYFDGTGYIKAGNTTPGISLLFELMRSMVDNGLVGFSMEVSSHALKQGRIGTLRFDYAIFTNLTRDHLDYHKSMEDYFFSKALLFTDHLAGLAIINAEDPYGRRLLSIISGKDIITYGIERGDVRGRIKSMDVDGMILEVDGISFQTNLTGTYNLYNILAVFSYGIGRGIDREMLVDAISEFKGVRGRMERIKTEKFTVFIDYAHTPDALRNVLVELSKLKKNRLIVVFGCGGDRDKGKRPEMGRIATQIADMVIITSDNPRSEDPVDIIRDILKGCVDKNYNVIVDRREAIAEALRIAREGDLVLVAGKGHEDYQIVKDKVFHFDDREVVLEILKEMGIDAET